jgi:hypothetical protein
MSPACLSAQSLRLWGWEDAAWRILRRYVDRVAATKNLIETMNRKKMKSEEAPQNFSADCG